MNDINQVVLVGRLVRDAEIKFTPSGVCLASISIANNQSKKNGDQWVDEAHYFDVQLWGKPAENLKPYLLKGKQIAVSGQLRQSRWKDKEGNNRTSVGIVATTVQLIGKSGEGSSSGKSFAPRAEDNTGSSMDEGFPEDIPF